MDTLGYLRSVSPSQASALIRGLLNNALLLTRTKTNLVFQAAQPVLEFKSAAPSNEDSPPLRARILADMRRNPTLWVAIAYQVTCVVYSLVFGIIILATARMFVLTILLYARYLAQENIKLKTLEETNRALEKTNADLNELVSKLTPLLTQISGTADNTQATAEKLGSLVPQVEAFVAAVNGSRELWEDVKATLKKHKETTKQLEETTKQLEELRALIAQETRRLGDQVTASGENTQSLTQIVQMLSSLAQEPGIRERLTLALAKPSSDATAATTSSDNIPTTPNPPQDILVQS